MNILDKKKIIDTVLEDGGCLIRQFLEGEALHEIEREFDAVFEEIPDSAHACMEGSKPIVEKLSYSAGKHLRLSPSNYANFPKLLQLMQSPYLINMTQDYFSSPTNYAMQVFMSHEYNVVDENSKINIRSNSHLHWDPYHSLKFFLYLTDVDESNGATHFVPKSRKLGKLYREEKMNLRSTSGLEGGVPNRLQDYEEDPIYTEKDAMPVKAKAGDLLVFDTDALHYGGDILEAGLERKLIIIHNRL